MNRSILKTLAFVFSALLLQPANAALKVGDPAPEIKVSRWVQGDEIKAFDGDKVYIVEFWATWCGPCISAIPHINEIYKRHKDQGLVVIGQNVWEKDDKVVPGFVSKMGAKMTYPVALDDKSTEGGFMASKWLKAAGQNGIPCAFIVNKSGKIAYIGHPMRIEETMLTSLLAEPSTKPATAATAAPSAPSAKAQQLAEQAQALVNAGKLDDAESVIADLNSELDPKFQYVGGLLDMNLMLARKQSSDAVELSKLLCEDFSGQPEVLNAVAAMLVSRPDATPALLAAAEKIATPLSKSDGEAKTAALATLARIASLRGAQPAEN